MLEYDDGEAPDAEVTVYEDQSKSILSANDSPDVGFRWSVNPYRGCRHACAYCLDGGTPILMADGSTRDLASIRVGDEIYGTAVEGAYRRYRRTQVLAHWQTVKPAYRVKLADGTELVASADHRFLTDRGWKHVTGSECGRNRRPFLTTANRLIGTGAFARCEAMTAEYERGYLCGMVRGDALLKTFRHQRAGRANGDQHQFRLALVDLDALRRTRAYLDRVSIATREFVFKEACGSHARMEGIRTHALGNVDRIRSIIEWPAMPTRDWRRGFLAGIFDAEGSRSRGVFRISNTDTSIVNATLDSLRALGFDAVLEPPGPRAVASNVRMRGGLREQLRFVHMTNPAIRRKWNLQGSALRHPKRLQVSSIERLGFDLLMFDFTTGTGDFIANGVVSHNCYARPSHEYLSFGAGTDFERKIVVKPRAPELLRESFEKKSWKGELVVFSGITDCYQPLESKLRLTRGCLEVCAEYRNPVGIITKSPVIERDIDVLQELARVASVRVSVSAPFWDPDVAKAMEPTVTTPERRMKIIETLAKAGIPTGVSVSPIVPGLNDDHLGDVLERARDAGAHHAFYVLLRLPGPVKDVFEKALREKLPLRAEKVLRRLREAHDGKLYDASFGARGRGHGVYADTIRMLFERTAKRCGLSADELTQYVAPSTFRRPSKHGQTSFGF